MLVEMAVLAARSVSASVAVERGNDLMLCCCMMVDSMPKMVSDAAVVYV